MYWLFHSNAYHFPFLDTEYLRDKIAKAAKDHKDTLFCFSDATVFADEVNRFGFDLDSKYDLHVGILGKDGEYYPRWDTTHMSSAMISEFVKQYKEGKVSSIDWLIDWLMLNRFWTHFCSSKAKLSHIIGATHRRPITPSPGSKSWPVTPSNPPSLRAHPTPWFSCTIPCPNTGVWHRASSRTWPSIPATNARASSSPKWTSPSTTLRPTSVSRRIRWFISFQKATNSIRPWLAGTFAGSTGFGSFWRSKWKNRRYRRRSRILNQWNRHRRRKLTRNIPNPKKKRKILTIKMLKQSCRRQCVWRGDVLQRFCSPLEISKCAVKIDWCVCRDFTKKCLPANFFERKRKVSSFARNFRPWQHIYSTTQGSNTIVEFVS